MVGFPVALGSFAEQQATDGDRNSVENENPYSKNSNPPSRASSCSKRPCYHSHRSETSQTILIAQFGNVPFQQVL
jgi:hypothetical protein